MVDGPRGWGKHIDWGDHGTSGWNDKYGGSGGGVRVRRVPGN